MTAVLLHGARIDIDPVALSFINARIAREHTRGEYRPEVAAVVESLVPDRPIGDFLVTRKAEYWAFPKGGVEKGETAIAGLLRELDEETGIEENATMVIASFLHAGRIETSTKPLNGFPKGTMCFFFHVVCSRKPDVRLKLDEACDYQWLSPDRVKEEIGLCGDAEHREKRRDMLLALRLAMNGRQLR